MTKTILPFKDQVPTLDTCRRLDEAGFPRGTQYKWHVTPASRRLWTRREMCGKTFSEKDTLLPAPTAAELGAVLPRKVYPPLQDGYYEPCFFLSQDDGGFVAAYRGAKEIVEDLRAHKDQESEARAQLYLYLHEHDLLPESASRVNKP